jgi:hypothetical protein
MAVVYAAHTESCTLMLDENGVCEWAAPTGTGTVPEKIIGAQFVASLDVSVPGALVGTPREGVPMLFAVTDAEGHISLIRTTNLVRFDDRRTDSGIVRTRETSVRTPSPFPTWRPSLGDLAPRGRSATTPPSRNNYAPPRFNGSMRRR